MRLAVAFRSLPRPSSPVEPSHPPDSMGASYLYLGPMTASLVEDRTERFLSHRRQKHEVLHAAQGTLTRYPLGSHFVSA